jgi:hypothetical protein
MIFSFLFFIGTLDSSLSLSPAPERVILFLIDGLQWQAPARIRMPVFNSLAKGGTFIERSWMILPHHPTVGDYSNFNSCSFPNPMLHAGTIFLRPENRYIQEVFSPARQTVFIVNEADYYSVARGFTTQIMDPAMSDRQVVDQAMLVLKQQDPVFMRIHLQSAGVLGTTVALNSEGKPYSGNIFAKGSPYITAVEEADRLLGKFVAFLKEEGKWEGTVLIISSDHGQSIQGWHPMFDEDSWVTPMVFAGKGIARQRELPYFEHTDLAPTIAWLLGSEAPNSDGGSGKAVKEILEGTDKNDYHPGMFLKTLNQQVKEYNMLKARMLLEAGRKPSLLNELAALENENLTPEPFYHQDRITDWYKAGSVNHLIEANEKVLQRMRKQLE